jgi:hypothetical protein
VICECLCNGECYPCNGVCLFIWRTYLSAFRPWGVPGPTSKFVAACPIPDGLARDGTQGRNVARVISHQGGVLVVGVTSVRARERVSLFASSFSRATRLPPPPPRRKDLDLPFIDARRGSRCTMEGVAYALTCLAERCLSSVYVPTWLSERCLSPAQAITWPSEKCLSPVEAQLLVVLGSC